MPTFYGSSFSINNFGVGTSNYQHMALDKGPEFTFEDDQSEYTRLYRGSWLPLGAVNKAVRNLLGFSYTATKLNPDGTLVGNYVSRITPHAIRDWLNLPLEEPLGNPQPYLYCTRVRGNGIAATQGTVSSGGPVQEQVPAYDGCELTATYRTLPYDILTDDQMNSQNYTDAKGLIDESTLRRYVIIIPKPAGEFFSIPLGTYSWVFTTGPKTVQQGIGKLLVYANLAITRIGVPWDSMPSWHVNRNLTAPAAIDTMLGKVNSIAFNQYEAGSLLLGAVEIKPRRSPFGVRIYDYTCYFRYFRQGMVLNSSNIPFALGHNFVYQPRTSTGPVGWTEVTSDGTTNLDFVKPNKSVYDWADLSRLFKNP